MVSMSSLKEKYTFLRFILSTEHNLGIKSFVIIYIELDTYLLAYLPAIGRNMSF